jgi:hypothetical protein
VVVLSGDGALLSTTGPGASGQSFDRPYLLAPLVDSMTPVSQCRRLPLTPDDLKVTLRQGGLYESDNRTFVRRDYSSFG